MRKSVKAINEMKLPIESCGFSQPNELLSSMTQNTLTPDAL